MFPILLKTGRHGKKNCPPLPACINFPPVVGEWQEEKKAKGKGKKAKNSLFSLLPFTFLLFTFSQGERLWSPSGGPC
jgi:hypothetical protein